MGYSSDFFRSIVDSVTEHIVIIDQNGAIRFVNAAWVRFGVANQCTLTMAEQWQGINYLDVCETSTANGDSSGQLVAAGTRRIIEQKAGIFYHEYPCDSESEKRWFMMRVTPLQWDRQSCFVISHQNITERKLAEEKVQALSLTDELTEIPNRRHFYDFLRNEWLRAARANSPLSLILLDIDGFKPYNDAYGHLDGDECLKRTGEVLQRFAQRPGDLCARYGGDEFALILGNTGIESASRIAHDLHAAIRDMNIAHCHESASPSVTVSLGVATMHPRHGVAENTLLQSADQALYCAKNNGRNQVAISKGQEP